MKGLNQFLKHDPNKILGRYKLFIEYCNTIQFLGKFLDDSQCPARVKNFLYTFIGEQLGHFKRQGLYQDYVQHSFLTQRWMEICR